MVPQKILFLILFTLKLASTARILGVFPFPSHSHHVVFESLYRELLNRGHEVVVITTGPQRDPTLVNLTEIDISYLYTPVPFISTIEITNYRTFMSKGFLYMERLVEEVFKNKEVMAMMTNKKEFFDLVIVEDMCPALYAFGARFHAPIIGITSLDALLSSHSAMGNPIHPVLFGDSFLDYTEPLSIFKKLEYAYSFVWFKIIYKDQMVRSDLLVKKYLGEGYPPMEEARKNLSFVFTNTNLVMDPIRPMVPNVVSTGFIHVKKPKALPLDLQKILDESSEGAIYFSLGSNIKSVNLPTELQKIIIEAISEVPYTVLWKWESDNVPDVGKNVVTRKWFPQQDILAHPNIRTFVMQGGLQSSEEAIARGVPMVTIPFVSDQHKNVKKLQNMGISISIEPSTMTKDILKNAIINVMIDSRYTRKIHELKAIIEDQPMTSLEKAVWWTEYVIRHKGAPHLRCIVADTPLYEYLLLDVIVVVLGSLILGSFAVYICLKFILRTFLSKRKVNVKDKRA